MLQPITFTRSQDISSKSQTVDVPTNPAAPSDASSRSTTSSLAFGWWQTLWADIDVIFTRDPAARNWLEVLFCYPGTGQTARCRGQANSDIDRPHRYFGTTGAGFEGAQTHSNSLTHG
ncbi:hypothetical protein BJP36_06590 [Moorena producens JHB]|uniref:Uncharacterized protein n=2 Tax=Moorena producens TaxID=1155739 RepID=A0A1D9FWV9_MOOP1|nr:MULTISPECIES: hypothetical protein [Moorena]AOY79640.1 hypothetical protein BJP36_06590 [Moorena producens JHB]